VYDADEADDLLTDLIESDERILQELVDVFEEAFSLDAQLWSLADRLTREIAHI
jgi:hypothetical protein